MRDDFTGRRRGREGDPPDAWRFVAGPNATPRTVVERAAEIMQSGRLQSLRVSVDGVLIATLQAAGAAVTIVGDLAGVDPKGAPKRG